jgi:hypothetical protein
MGRADQGERRGGGMNVLSFPRVPPYLINPLCVAQGSENGIAAQLITMPDENIIPLPSRSTRPTQGPPAEVCSPEQVILDALTRTQGLLAACFEKGYPSGDALVIQLLGILENKQVLQAQDAMRRSLTERKILSDRAGGEV